MKHTVFVYGTLMKKSGSIRCNSIEQEGGTYLGEGTIRGEFSRAEQFYYPALIKTPGTVNEISGEFHSVDDRALRVLDLIEGHPNFYRRELVATENGEAWVYFLTPEHLDEHLR